MTNRNDDKQSRKNKEMKKIKEKPKREELQETETDHRRGEKTEKVVTFVSHDFSSNKIYLMDLVRKNLRKRVNEARKHTIFLFQHFFSFLH